MVYGGRTVFSSQSTRAPALTSQALSGVILANFWRSTPFKIRYANLKLLLPLQEVP